jgi:hypothetical protein
MDGWPGVFRLLRHHVTEGAPRMVLGGEYARHLGLAGHVVSVAVCGSPCWPPSDPVLERPWCPVCAGAPSPPMEEVHMSYQDHVGYRYLRWTHDVEPHLNAAERADGNDAFAAEFEALARNRQPYEGWAEAWPTSAGASPAGTGANPSANGSRHHRS